MKFIIAIALSVVISYLLGSCNSAIIFVRLLKGEDIRNFGSKNAGLTNTLRCFGKFPALLTLIGDLSKGIIAVIICRVICSLMDVGMGPDNSTHFIGYIAGFFAIIGHVFPLYYGFKGGKGVLVGASVFLVIDPPAFLGLILIFAIVLALSKYVSLASITAAFFNPFVTLAMQLFIYDQSVKYAVIYALMAVPSSVAVIFMHHSNIRRLIDGNENKFSFGSKK